MTIQKNKINIHSAPVDLKNQLSHDSNGVIAVAVPPFYKRNKTVESARDKFLFAVSLADFNFGLKQYENLFQLKGDTNSGSKKSDNYYIITPKKNKLDDFFKTVIPQIRSELFNGMYAKIQSDSTADIVVAWYDSKNWYKLKQHGRNDKDSTPFYNLKREYGATTTLGNGFFYKAGIFENGKRDTTSGRYVLVRWTNAPETGKIEAIGKGGDILQAVNSLTQTSSGSDTTRHNYVLLKIVDNTDGYEEVCGTVGLIGTSYQKSLSEISLFLNSPSSDISLDTSTSDGSNWSGGGINFSTAEINPYTGLTSNTTAQIEYIKDFPNYTLNFKCGKDKRSTITDLFGDNPENKIISDLEGTDSENLILKVKILPEQILQASSGMSLSDKYYLYVEMTSDSSLTEEAFFAEIDEKLNLDFENSNHIWKEDKIPIDVQDNWKIIPQTVCAITREDYNSLTDEEKVNLSIQTIKDKQFKQIGLKDFITNEERPKWKLLVFNVIKNEDKFETKISDNNSLTDFLNTISFTIKYTDKKSYSATFSFIQERKPINLYSLELLEAYTRGHDFIQENYTTVRAKEIIDNERVMNFDDNYFVYKYTGRDFDIMRKRDDKGIFTFSNGVAAALVHECDLLLESDVTLGESYGQKKYFIEYLKYLDNQNKPLYKDTFKLKDYLKAVDATKYIEEDLEVVTSTIDLTQCQYYDPTAATFENKWCDCSFGTGGEYKKECVYQKLGYCPYRFQTEKHPRRIRTLSQEKSNRFNIIQELSQVFKIYPQFYIEFDRNGKVKLDENGRMKKHVFFMTEKGNKNQLGFRYEKNLADISRTVDSTSLTTKLFVENVDSELSPTGLCSIQTAEDNIARTSYILDFSYYTKMNILDPIQVTRDLYGLEKGDFAFLPTIGYYNTQYDKLTNLIVNLTGETMVKLQAENDTYIQGVTTALEEKQKICQKMYQFKVKSTKNEDYDYTISDSYKNYLIKMKEQSTILWGLVETLFFTNDYCNFIEKVEDKYVFTSVKIKDNANEMATKYRDDYCNGELFWRILIEGFEEEEEYKPLFSSWADFKEEIIDKQLYPINGCIGQYNDMLAQIKKWKTERAKWLNKINDISEQFYKKYEPFIKEGTWTDSNYLTDNEYYWAAQSVLNDSSQPKVTYTLKIVNLSPLDEDYKFELADTSFVEDIDFFGINQKTGLPNQQKVLVSGLTYDLDIPSNDSIDVRNYTSSFDELFQSITASVQSLTFNENTYKRASNFTATKYIEKDALQGTLFDGDLTLVKDYSENITIDDKGIEGKNIGNDALGYKLDGEGLAFTRDNGQTYDIGVGPNGINADYIKFGQLDASKIQIVDGNYIYFLWDKDGLNAYRNPATSTNGLVDFARFNKYGLSLIENNNVRLRAGYEFKNDPIRNTSGRYDTELDLEKQNIGFYLYNDSGQAIFKTETASDYAGVEGDYSARLSLTGEMFITNKVLEGENDGSIVSKTAEVSLQGSWLIVRQNVLTLYSQNIWLNLFDQLYNTWQSNFGFSDDGKANNICIENGTATTDKITFKTSEDLEGKSQVVIPVYVFRALPRVLEDGLDYTYDATNKTITKVKSSLYRKLSYNYIKYALTLSGDEYTATKDDTGTTVEASIDTIQGKIINAEKGNYALLTTWVKYKDDGGEKIEQTYTSIPHVVYVNSFNDPTETTITTGNIVPAIVTYFDISKATEGDIIEETTQQLYPYSYGTSGGTVNYWSSRTETGNYITQSTSAIKTDEVGIFINNKLGVDDTTTSSRNEAVTEEVTEETPEDTPEEQLSLFSSRASNIDITDPSFLIIGDSITEGLSSTDLKENAFGVGSSNFGGASQFTGLQSLTGKTTVAYFMGMNEDYRANDTDESYQERYKSFIDETLGYLKAGGNEITSIYVISVTALDESLSGSTKTTENIEQSNQAISKMPETYSEINGFIDVYSASKNFEHSDKVHFTINGLNDLFKQIQSAFSGAENIGGTTTPGVAEDPGARAAADTALGGAERIFTIALKGQNDSNETEYKNILTVLKNGYLYMGGTITDFYGNTLELSNFNLLPDKVRIASPQLILSNSGYMWFDFYKTFPIGQDGTLETGISLMDLIMMGGGAGGSTSGTTTGGLPAGYYLVDPLAD